MKVAVIGGGLGGLAAACMLAARGYEVVLFEKNPWLGGKAALLEEQGFRFDMGPTILTCRRCCGGSSPRPAATLERRARPRPARPAVALLLRRRLDARPASQTPTRWPARSTPSRPARARRRLPRFLELSRAAARDLRAVLLLAARSARSATCSTSKTAFQPGDAAATCWRCAWAARSPARSGSHVPDAAGRPDARPLHPVRRLVARRARRRCSAASPTCRPREGVWYPARRHPRRARGAARAGARARRRVPRRDAAVAAS